MSLRCIVVDDEPLGRKLILDHISNMPDLTVEGEFKSAVEADIFIQQHDVDLIFLDINMPKLSGIQWLRQLAEGPLVIFTTAYSDYAVEAFEVEAFDFLVKPISYERFMTSVNRAKKYLSGGHQKEPASEFISIKEGKRLYKINLNTIDYLQAFGDYVRIFTEEKTYITKERMHLLIEQLPSDFIQVHRSYVINVKKIVYLEGNFVKLADQKIPVSNKFRQDLLDML